MRNRWLRSGAIKLHVLVVVVVVPMLALGVWQVRRALDGNTQSWAYAVQWPAFALYAIYMWWSLLHDQPGFRRRRRRPDPELVEEARAQQADEDIGPGPRHVPGPDSPPDGMTSMPRRLRR